MNEWWSALSMMQKAFFTMAFPASLILLIQTVMLVIGLGGDESSAADAAGSPEALDSADVHDVHDVQGGHDGDGDGGHGDDGLHVFSVRGIVSFFAIGGWAGFACLSNGVAALIALIVAFLAGAATMVALAKMIQSLMHLQESGNVSKKNALGKMGSVYLRIPEAGKGMGKVNVVVQEQLREFDAVSIDKEIPTGTAVRVVGIETGGVLAVAPEKPEKQLPAPKVMIQ